MVDNSYQECEQRKTRYASETLAGEGCPICCGIKGDDVCLLCDDTGTYWAGKVIDKLTGKVLYENMSEYGLSMGYSFRPLEIYQNKLLRRDEKDNHVKQR